MKQLLRYIILGFFLIVGMGLQAQNATITTNPYKNKIRIGEPIQVDISVNLAGANTFYYPRFDGDTLTAQIELTQPIQVDTNFANSADKSSILGFSVHMFITSFDSGLWAVPQIPFIINSDTVLSEAFLIEVTTVEVDTSEAFAPIIGPKELPYTWREIAEMVLEYGAWAYGILLTLAVIIFLLGKTPKPKPPEEEEKITIPPHQIALRRLNELKDEQLLAKGAIKAFHVQVSDITRQYIENRFNVLARESTTPEIKHMLKQIGLPSALRKQVIDSLKLSDLVKFAKAQPEQAENEACLEMVYDLIYKTIPAEPEKPAKADE
jgi:hypothetical protein